MRIHSIGPRPCQLCGASFSPTHWRIIYCSDLCHFTRNTRFSGPEDCWSWIGNCDPKGYGYSNFNGQKLYAYRRSYLMFNGDIPPKMDVRHLCHNPNCVNPKHLSYGTRKENMADMIAAGRTTKGRVTNTKVPKFNSCEVNHIRTVTTNRNILAAEYKCHPDLISRVRKRKGTYK